MSVAIAQNVEGFPHDGQTRWHWAPVKMSSYHWTDYYGIFKKDATNAAYNRDIQGTAKHWFLVTNCLDKALVWKTGTQDAKHSKIRYKGIKGIFILAFQNSSEWAHLNSSPDTAMKFTFKSSHYNRTGDLLQKDSKELWISSGAWKLHCYGLHKHRKVLPEIVAGVHKINIWVIY